MFFRNGMLVMTADDYITHEEDRCVARQTDKAYRDVEMHSYKKNYRQLYCCKIH